MEAVAATRQRCWEYDWVVEFDISRAFDELDWSLLRKAIAKHVKGLSSKSRGGVKPLSPAPEQNV
jgi:retron-type reverse transcriptase